MIPSSQDNLRRPSQSPYLYCAPLGLNKAVKLSGMPTPNLKSRHCDLVRKTHERISFLWNHASPARLNSFASFVIPSGFSPEESALKEIRFHA
jgi:hypothetical protein